MQIVINIPKDMRISLDNGSFGAKYNIYDLCGCVMNGTILPKNHGRLIDADQYKIDNANIIDCEIDHRKYQNTLRELIDAAPTVIEAERSK